MTKRFEVDPEKRAIHVRQKDGSVLTVSQNPKEASKTKEDSDEMDTTESMKRSTEGETPEQKKKQVR